MLTLLAVAFLLGLAWWLGPALADLYTVAIVVTTIIYLAK